MRKTLIATAAFLAAVVVFLLATLPPSPVVASGEPDPDIARRTVAGAYHVHTSRSDGAATRDEIAAAASRAGLQFVIFTDHGDATENAAPPQYLHGVLCVDGIEVSTNGGHYVVLGIPTAPYPLGGEADAVVEDVRRLGGFGVVAHPESEKIDLRWKDWSLLVDGVEWLNADSQWRDEPVRRLVRLPFDYLFRPAGALASMLDRPDDLLGRWDELAAGRRIIGLGGLDAHGGVAVRQEGGQRLGRLGIPSYEASFSAFGLRVVLPQPLDRDAVSDARRLLAAVRAGRVFTAVTALASPAWLELRARQEGIEAEMGDTLRPDLPVTFSVRTAGVSGAEAVLVCNGTDVERSPTGLQTVFAGPGACRAEVRVPGAPGSRPIPWIVSNHIYLHPAPGETLVNNAPEIVETTLEVPTRALVVEKDASSSARLKATDGTASLAFQLASGGRVSQYVALASPIAAPVREFDRVVFTARASRPLRLSVQLRFDERGGARWGTSVYVPGDSVRFSVPLARFVPFAPGSTPPDWTRATGLLLVIDLTNARPGFDGRLDVSDLALGLAASSR